MRLLRLLARDLLTAMVWRDWWYALIQEMPGALGYELRRRAVQPRLKRAGGDVTIYRGVRIFGAPLLSVGRNVRIAEDCIIQANGGVEIGDDVLFGPGVKIWSVNHVSVRTDVPIYEQGYEHKPVRIGNGVWLGANSFIMPGASIGDHVIVSAGSVVAGKDVEPYAILAGNPARKVGTRLDRAPDALPAAAPAVGS